MADVYIFQPSKTAMQSGRANTKTWMMEFAPSAPKLADPLMGWLGSSDTRSQLRLRFPSREDAVAFAAKHSLSYQVQEPQTHHFQPKSYAENFRS